MLLQMPAREEQRRSCAFPSSEQRQAGEIPSPADSQGHRWSRKQPKTLPGCRGFRRSRQPRVGLSPALPIWVGVCAQRQAWPQSSSVHGCAHTHTHTPPPLPPPVARQPTAGRQGDAGASSLCWGAARGGHGCQHHRSSRHPVQLLHPGSGRHGAHPPACSCRPSSPSSLLGGCSRWFLWELGRKTGFPARPVPKHSR